MLKQKLTDNPDGEENNRKARLENLEDRMLKMWELYETQAELITVLKNQNTESNNQKYQDSDDKPVFRIDPERFDTIQGKVNEIERYSNWREFVDEALGLFITWWTEPPKTMNLIYEMWPDLTEEMHAFWKTNPNTKDSYVQFKAGAEAYHKQKREGRTAVLNAAKGLEQSISFEQREQTVRPDAGDLQDPISYEGNQPATHFTKIAGEASEKIETIYHYLSDTKEGIRQFLDEDKFKTPKNAIPHDGYPLIYDYYTRFLPAKILVTALAGLINTNDGNPVSYKVFREHAYLVALGFSEKLRTKEAEDLFSRNEKISTGLPMPPLVNQLDFRSMDSLAKFDSSKQRFLTHYIGLDEDAWKNKKKRCKRYNKTTPYFDGALNSMGLAYFMDTDEGLKIGLTELGAKFARLNNPVIDDNSIVRKNAFSEDECIFIKKYIISRFELETMVTEKLVHRLMSLQSPDMPDKSLDIPEINKDFETQTLDWLQKEEKRIEKEKKKLEKPTTQEKNDLEYSYNIINKGRIDDKKRSTWRVATMGRLAEIKVVDWRIDQKGKSHYTAKNI